MNQQCGQYIVINGMTIILYMITTQEHLWVSCIMYLKVPKSIIAPINSSENFEGLNESHQGSRWFYIFNM